MRARKTLKFYQALPGMDPEFSAGVVDLVTDLLHLANRKGLGAETVIRRALGHLESENEG